MDANEDVFRLDIAVHYVLLVEVLERGGHLGNVLSSLPFRETLFFAQVLVQLSLSSELENEEDALGMNFDVFIIAS